jgi:hypothetical protein
MKVDVTQHLLANPVTEADIFKSYKRVTRYHNPTLPLEFVQIYDKPQRV